jgi:hypothetical protein
VSFLLPKLLPWCRRFNRAHGTSGISVDDGGRSALIVVVSELDLRIEMLTDVKNNGTQGT